MSINVKFSIEFSIEFNFRSLYVDNSMSVFEDSGKVINFVTHFEIILLNVW